MGTLEVIHVGILLKPAAPVQREFMRMLNAKKRFSSTLSLSWSAPESQAIVNQRGLFWFNFYMFSTCLLTTRSCENSVDLSFCSFYPGDDFLFPFFIFSAPQIYISSDFITYLLLLLFVIYLCTCNVCSSRFIFLFPLTESGDDKNHHMWEMSAR